MASNWTLIKNGNVLNGSDDSLGAGAVLIRDNLIERIGGDVGPQLVP